jgi:hypothetical protein
MTKNSSLSRLDPVQAPATQRQETQEGSSKHQRHYPAHPIRPGIPVPTPKTPKTRMLSQIFFLEEITSTALTGRTLCQTCFHNDANPTTQQTGNHSRISSSNVPSLTLHISTSTTTIQIQMTPPASLPEPHLPDKQANPSK